jgi:hypothetical protein
LDTGVLRRGTLGGIAQEDRSSQTVLRARRREGALGEETEALLSLQREALAGLAAAGAAGRELLLALSLTKARFEGKDSIKLEEVMVTV